MNTFTTFMLFCFTLGALAQNRTFTAPLDTQPVTNAIIDARVDSIMNQAIEAKAFPGATLLVAKSGSIIFNKTYGFHTYDGVQKVTPGNLYDLASVTKVAAALPAIMKLVDEGKLDLDEKFSTYWKPWKRRKDKRDLTLREILAHQAGLEPYIVFLNDVLKIDGSFKRRFVRSEKSRRFSVETYNGLFLNKRFVRKMYRKVNRSEVSEEKKYKYSGLTFLLYPQIVENLTGIPYEQYLQENFYIPLDAENIMFNPEKHHFPESRIIPTEEDSVYRKAYVKGWVHDENASLLGGVSGNAGLFATAEDLAKLMQMYVNMGIYNNKRYISEATLKEFTRVQYPDNDNRRGLGFDKPYLNNAENVLPDSYPNPEVSASSFGHSGFTGTFVWADPEHELVFVFLSNRVYPTRTHTAIYDLNVRPRLMHVFYQELQFAK